MKPNDLANLVFSDSNRITAAISTGSAWEIWLQVEMVLLGRAARYGVGREIPFPSGAQKLDLLFQDTSGLHAVEMKVESANNAGNQVLNAIQADVAKLRSYQAPGVVARWVLGIAYSASARAALQSLANAQPQSCQYGSSQDGLGVIVIDVT